MGDSDSHCALTVQMSDFVSVWEMFGRRALPMGKCLRNVTHSVAEPEPRAKEPKLNCRNRSRKYELMLRQGLQVWLLSDFQRLEEIFVEKNHGC